MLVDSFRVDSPHVEYTEGSITSTYEYQTTEFEHEQKRNGQFEWLARPKAVSYEFRMQRKVPTLGGISYVTKDGVQHANYFGISYPGFHIPCELLPVGKNSRAFQEHSADGHVDPNDIVIGAMDRARVLDINLQKQLRPLMQDMVPMPGIYDQRSWYQIGSCTICDDSLCYHLRWEVTDRY